MIVATDCYGVGLLSAYPIGKIMISTTCMTHMLGCSWACSILNFLEKM